MKRLSVLQSLAVLFVFSQIAWGAVPQLINFQGILKDGSGNPVANGSYSVTFTIYDAATGGNNLWTETQSVSTTSGLFAVLLGSANPVPDAVFNDTSLWLGTTVSPDPEMTPRQRLVSVAYAYRVAHFIPDYGANNTFIGRRAGNLTMANGGNTASGFAALSANTDGSENTASGNLALRFNTLGSFNTASGAIALNSNTTGFYNTACGTGALELNTTAFYNTASGAFALANNTTGNSNTASGANVLLFSTTGNDNTAFGANALLGNTTGDSNTAIGANADVSLGNLTNATAIGSGAIVDASNKIRLGNSAVTLVETDGNFKVGADDTIFSSNFSSNSPLALQAPAGSTRMYIDDVTGNVGIGTSAPAERLTVKGTTSNGGGNIASFYNSNNVLKSEISDRGEQRWYIQDATNAERGSISYTVPTGVPGIAFLDASGTSRSDFRHVTGGGFALAAGSGAGIPTEWMRLTASGNVGIGTTSPGAKLSLGTNGSNTKLALYDFPGDQYGLGVQSFQFRLHLGNAMARFSFLNSAAGTELVTIQGSGNVGIGTTSPGASNLLELASTTKGFVLPRMTKAQRDAIFTPVAGMAVYQTDNTPGLRVYNGTNWMRFTETAD